MKNFEVVVYAKEHTGIYSLQSVKAESKEHAIKSVETKLPNLIKEAKSYYKSEEVSFMLFSEALPLIKDAEDKAFKVNEVKEISEERYYDMLEVLPPEKWETVQVDNINVTIFRMMEYVSGNITSHYCKMGEFYCVGIFRTSKDYKEIAKLVINLKK